MRTPPSSTPADATRLLRVSAAGDEEATHRLFEVLYEQLRILASCCLGSRAAGQTLGPTALVHEAFVKLAEGQAVAWQDRAHFVAVAVRAIRQVLIDHARAQGAQKRGGGGRRVQLLDTARLTGETEVDWERLERALDGLAEMDARAARVVELRFFGGLTGEEIGGLLGVSRTTVDKDWRHAKAWLRAQLGEGR